jgi:hypothetical protein
MRLRAARTGGRNRSLRLWRRRQSPTRRRHRTPSTATPRHKTLRATKHSTETSSHLKASHVAQILMTTIVVMTSLETTVVKNPRGGLWSKARAPYDETVSIEQRRRVSRGLLSYDRCPEKWLKIPKILGHQQFGDGGNDDEHRYARY